MKPSDAPALIQFEQADIGYDGHPAIHRLDLTIDAGEVLAVLGPNGSGKSTLVRGVLGLAALQHGSVKLFGIERSHFKQWRRVGYVPQRGTVSGGIPSTVREVVASGRLALLPPWRPMRAADRRRVHDAIEAVGLPDKADEPIGSLSGGQQRRALIARALASDPELLILDEPTAGVDHENQGVLAEILMTLAEAGTTIVLVTHELGPFDPLVTRTIVLNSGLIVHDGTSAEAPNEHDDEWHHQHGTSVKADSPLGLEGTVGPNRPSR